MLRIRSPVFYSSVVDDESRNVSPALYRVFITKVINTRCFSLSFQFFSYQCLKKYFCLTNQRTVAIMFNIYDSMGQGRYSPPRKYARPGYTAHIPRVTAPQNFRLSIAKRENIHSLCHPMYQKYYK